MRLSILVLLPYRTTSTVIALLKNLEPLHKVRQNWYNFRGHTCVLLMHKDFLCMSILLLPYLVVKGFGKIFVSLN